jgi:predicted metal-dependent peptidase
MAMDFVVNDVIFNLKDKSLCRLPDGCLYDPMFHDWSVRQVFDYLWKEREQEKQKPKPPEDGKGNPDNRQGGNNGKPQKGSGPVKRGNPMDKHDHHGKQGKDGKGGNNLTPTQQRELERKIGEALQQGGILAGKMGADVPRAIKEAMEPEIKWEDVLTDFWSSTMRGVDEYTWARPNRRRLADDLYLPSSYSETLGEIVIAIDTSGSIDQRQIDRVAARVANLCELFPPEQVRVLWWDTQVHGEQVFEAAQYGQIDKLLKPRGGGGTRVSCVSEYINSRAVKTEAVIVFTDGHVEDNVKWDINAPTLWLVTHSRRFNPPSGNKVMVKE